MMPVSVYSMHDSICYSYLVCISTNNDIYMNIVSALYEYETFARSFMSLNVFGCNLLLGITCQGTSPTIHVKLL